MFFANWPSYRDHLKEKLPGTYLHLKVIYKEDFSCDFPDHTPPKRDLLIEDLFKIRESALKGLSMNHFERLLADPSQEEFQGFLVCEGGTLSEGSRAPSMGFCIQKTQASGMLSRYTENLLRKYNIPELVDGKKIVGAHSFNSVHVIHTTLYKWLTLTFGWEHRPLILHALLWKSRVYEGPIVDYFLRERRAVIKKMETCPPQDKTSLAIRKATIKLVLCSSYGYCSLNSGSGASKYKKSTILSWKQLHRAEYNLKIKRRQGLPPHLTTAVAISPNSYKVYYEQQQDRPAPLISHGAAILAISKLVFLRSVYFLLAHLSPDRSQIIYMDTDSIHLSVSKENLLENVPTHLRSSYIEKRDEFFDENRAPSGQLIIESVVDYEKVFSEKVYILSTLKGDDLTVKTLLKSRASKGIPYNIEIHKDINPFFGLQQSMMRRLGKSKGVGISVINKQLGGLLIPRRRYFITESFSTPFLFPHEKPDLSLLYNAPPTPSPNSSSSFPHTRSSSKKHILAKSPKPPLSAQREKNPPRPSLRDLCSKVPDSREIVDKAYQLKRKSGDYEFIYLPPKKMKKSRFIEYEASQS